MAPTDPQPTLPLEAVYALARDAHAGQIDPDGLPHIAHCERVSDVFDDPEAKIAAILHDVLEDSDLTADDLRRQGVSKVVVEAVVILTKRPLEEYRSYLARVADAPGEAGSLARRVKVADVRDNLARSERSNLPDRIEKYRFALDYLTTRVPS